MFERPRYLDELIKFENIEFIKVITGVRRCGKSFLLKLYKEHLLKIGISPKNIIYLNFEDYDTIDLHYARNLFLYLKERNVNNKNMYFLFDEIQYVNDWQRLLIGLEASFNANITITVNNKSMLFKNFSSHISRKVLEN